ncbi:MAG: sigma-70 family RNA polymerase sigma factor [Candidatus Moranbacteria bacterium]|nr:sigma-70 family RNA polymerase sigma factor [Candidatus Moranbacteria bacterium]
MAITDEKLVQNFLAGDEKALEMLIDRFLKPVFGFVFQLVRDESAAEDIVQETFVKVWKNISKFDAKKKFSTWVFAIAKNTAIDHLKKKKTLPFSAFESEDGNGILDNLEDETILHSNALLQKMDNVKEAENYLNSLSPELRTILLLHHQQGFSLVEIAEILSAPTNTIKSKHHRAVLFLRQQLALRTLL